jgi:tRNA (mo5U34)-methyltransferase
MSMHWPQLPKEISHWPLEKAHGRFSTAYHGDFNRWSQALDSLPPLQIQNIIFGDTVTASGITDQTKLADALQQLRPWRKGPFQIGDVKIDTEWRSDWKWQRIAPHLGNLSGQTILDVGCGNGYFGWRMLGAGASQVIGIDPTLLFCLQHLAIQHYIKDPRNWVLPLKIEEIPITPSFDQVLSMGVIYHRRDPLEHVHQLACLTRPGGGVLLESLVVDAPQPLQPSGRYARMRNVWCIPTVSALHDWLRAAGLTDIKTIDVSTTRTTEQRRTRWMHFDSLEQALNQTDHRQTVEGHPAPCRAVVAARKPSHL